MRILIADDHAMVRDGLRPYLTDLTEDTQVIDAATLDQALAEVDRQPVDVLLLDLEMPGMRGVASVCEVCRRMPDTMVVVLSGRSDPQTVADVLDSGAKGFLPKSMAARALVHALRLIVSDGSYFPAEILAARSQATELETHKAVAASPHGPLAALTRREYDIALMLAQGGSNKEIARALGMTDVTVKSHLRNIFRKIGVQNRTQAATMVLREMEGRR